MSTITISIHLPEYFLSVSACKRLDDDNLVYFKNFTCVAFHCCSNILCCHDFRRRIFTASNFLLSAHFNRSPYILSSPGALPFFSSYIACSVSSIQISLSRNSALSSSFSSLECLCYTFESTFFKFFNQMPLPPYACLKRKHLAGTLHQMHVYLHKWQHPTHILILIIC